LKPTADLAKSVLLLDDQVDEMNDAAFYALSTLIKERPELTRNLSTRSSSPAIWSASADHATNIAEDVIFWVRGADVRHNTTIA